jgi:flagellar protein FlgJ
MTVAPISTQTAAQPERPQPERAQLSAAAKQFEAIFVRQMLAEARKTDFGGEQLFGGQAMDTFRQMQDERFAEVAAQTGALGIARQVEAQLAARLSPLPLAEGAGGGPVSQASLANSFPPLTPPASGRGTE